MKKDSKKAFYYSIGYVVFCTLYLYSLYPSDPFSFEGLNDNIIYLFIGLLTLPGQLFSWGIRFGGTDSMINEILLVVLSQFVNIILWWRIILYVRRK